jgi:glycosyltransferase involved in cell wall biosynthesis
MATKNEARNVPLVVAELALARDQLAASEIDLTLIVVDDASSDGTVERIVTESSLRCLSVKIVPGPQRGLSRAIAFGLSTALEETPDAISVLDFDGQHDALELPRLVFSFFEANPPIDTVFGSRFLDKSTFVGVTLSRRILSHGARAALRMATRTRLPSDPTTSFRVSSPAIVESFLRHVPVEDLGGYEFFFWFAVYCSSVGTFHDEPIVFRPRLTGSSNLRTRDVLRAGLTLREVALRCREWQRHRIPGGGFPPYPTEYLDNLAGLDSYNSWLVGTFAEFVKGHVLEIGAGTGTVTQRIAQLSAVESVTAVEPDHERWITLSRLNFRASAKVSPLHGTIADVSGTYDTVVYCNSAEHIFDIASELRQSLKRCAPNGRVIVFGPAHEAIYGELDRVSGHWRRFSCASLERDLRAAGYVVTHSKYLDPLGAPAYYLGSRIGGASLSPPMLWAFERIILPSSIVLNHATKRLFGKNVLVVATPKTEVPGPRPESAANGTTTE